MGDGRCKRYIRGNVPSTLTKLLPFSVFLLTGVDGKASLFPRSCVYDERTLGLGEMRGVSTAMLGTSNAAIDTRVKKTRIQQQCPSHHPSFCFEVCHRIYVSPPLKKRQQQQTDMEITKQSQYHYNKPHGPSTHPPAPESSLRPFSQTFYTEPASYRHLPLEI